MLLLLQRTLVAALSLTLAAAQKACAPELCTGAGTGSCPISKGLTSKPSVLPHVENVYFRNAAPFTADILRVDEQGQEISYGLLPSGMRRAVSTAHGDVWVARAVRPGTSADRRLLLEHRIGAVAIEDCDCPQPSFVDCSKPPTMRSDGDISDPVVFVNKAAEPVDIFFYNGTCEELVSWNMIGGVQPLLSQPLLSTQGHAFRLRSAATRRMLMAHTLDDVVIRACDEDEARLKGSSLDGLDSVRAELRFFEAEAARLREDLATRLARLSLALSERSLGGGAANATRATPAAAAFDVAVSGEAVPRVVSALHPLLAAAAK